ncbi:Spo0B domain-containing protein [Ornithinibacillus halophilus]|uniref:Sporulation initiation phospho-transferase B, C-terminal n=1 Tax=Ornithinibacillus halophilus TaxID=930117 RepID=A0A1M5DFM9_9BACI|nr:Spo0B domain-containing protein [Ornithinibacillus halophilus]SHF65664.1 Sporulation initiation phospho-transferase B, C-terminal [Ornithinibacillus halophilus]
MNTKDIIQLLRHQRHDMMNHLQVMQGYLSMGKTDKVHKKMEDVIESFANERKLMNLETDELALWLIQFNTINKNIRLTYDICIEKQKLTLYEAFILKKCQYITEMVQSYGDSDQLYEAKLVLSNENDGKEVWIEFSISGSFQHMGKLTEKLSEQEDIDTQWEENEVICRISINTSN